MKLFCRMQRIPLRGTNCKNLQAKKRSTSAGSRYLSQRYKLNDQTAWVLIASDEAGRPLRTVLLLHIPADSFVGVEAQMFFNSSFLTPTDQPAISRVILRRIVRFGRSAGCFSGERVVPQLVRRGQTLEIALPRQLLDPILTMAGQALARFFMAPPIRRYQRAHDRLVRMPGTAADDCDLAVGKAHCRGIGVDVGSGPYHADQRPMSHADRATPCSRRTGRSRSDARAAPGLR